MDQHRASLRPPFEDVDVDDTPALAAGDRAALDAIRRQLAEEYPDGDGVPSPPSIEPGITFPVPRARARRQWRSPTVAALVTLAAVGGSVVGAAVTLHALRDPTPVTLVGTEEVAASRPAAAPPAALPAAAPRRTDKIAASMPDVPVSAAEAASPSVAPPASGIRPAPRTGIADATAPVVAPEPQGWSDSFQPLSAEAAAHAGVTKAAFTASRASRVLPPDPPPWAPPLPAPAPSVPPAVASPRPSPAPPSVAEDASSPRDQGLLTSIRQDWKTVKSGFESAPEEFRRAWGSFTRDLKGLLDR